MEKNLDIFVSDVKAEAISGVVLVTFGVRFPAYKAASLINKVSKQTHR